MQVIRNMKQKNLLQESGLKSTEARIALLNLLDKEDNPLDVYSIAESLRARGVVMDQATIYRILDVLTEKGLISRLEFGEGKYRYELQKSHHHHLVCQNCGKIEDTEGNFIDQIENEIRTEKGFLVKSHSLEFFGICKNCQY